MIIALFALAVVMIVGGIASVIQGFPFVRLESGLAMTIAGAGTASAGAILLGIATVAMRLRSLQTVFAARDAAVLPRTGRQRDEDEGNAPATLGLVAEAPSNAGMSSNESVSVRQRPSLAGIGLGGAGLGLGTLAGLSATRLGAEPAFVEPHAPEEAEPLLPDLLPPAETPSSEPEADRHDQDVRPPLTDAHATEPLLEPSALETQDNDLFLPPGTAPLTAEIAVPPVLPPHEAAEPPVETPATGSTPTEEEAPLDHNDAVHVVGTYASGGNTYVMFSNGSIEAETPKGRFNFSSLDELKVFVESGGESDARGAA